MSVYVDNYRCPATVGRVRGRWSHLTADTEEELHDFAQRLGLRRAWFQGHCKTARCPRVNGTCAHFHYDVVDTKRDQAIRAGAQPVDIRVLGAIVSNRRAAFRREAP